jgi:hypothetical protein
LEDEFIVKGKGVALEIEGTTRAGGRLKGSAPNRHRDQQEGD